MLRGARDVAAANPVAAGARLAPDILCDLDDQAQLGGLVVAG